MKSVIEQLMDLFVFANCESSELCFVMPKLLCYGKSLVLQGFGQLQWENPRYNWVLDQFSAHCFGILFFPRSLWERVENQVELAKLRFLGEGLTYTNCPCKSASPWQSGALAPNFHNHDLDSSGGCTTYGMTRHNHGVIPQTRSGKESSATAPNPPCHPEFISGSQKLENHTKMSFRRHEVSKESSHIYPLLIVEGMERRCA